MTSGKKYSPEFKAQAVALANDGSRSTALVARELGINPDTLRGWVQKERVSRGAAESLDDDERVELGRLRRRVAELELEKQILKKAAVFFAKETEHPTGK